MALSTWDIRPENILISEGGDGAWVIDFEFADITKDGDEAKMTEILQETQAVKDLLTELKNHRDHSCHELPHNNGVAVIATHGEAY